MSTAPAEPRSAEMKRYALFVGDCFYPQGGWTDFKGSFDSAEDAKAAAAEPKDDAVSGWWYNVADLQTGEIVDQGWGLRSRWEDRPATNDPDVLTGDEEFLSGTKWTPGQIAVLLARRAEET